MEKMPKEILNREFDVDSALEFFASRTYSFGGDIYVKEVITVLEECIIHGNRLGNEVQRLRKCLR